MAEMSSVSHHAGVLVSFDYQGDTLWSHLKRDSRLRSCWNQIGQWTCLWGGLSWLLVYLGGPHPWWVVPFFGQVLLNYIRKLTESELARSIHPWILLQIPVWFSALTFLNGKVLPKAEINLSPKLLLVMGTFHNERMKLEDLPYPH